MVGKKGTEQSTDWPIGNVRYLERGQQNTHCHIGVAYMIKSEHYKLLMELTTTFQLSPFIS